jgi:hypothetical protein
MLIDVKKAFDELKQPVMIKNTQKVKNQGTFTT